MNKIKIRKATLEDFKDILHLNSKNKLGVKFYKKHDFKDYNLTLIKKLE